MEKRAKKIAIRASSKCQATKEGSLFAPLLSFISHLQYFSYSYSPLYELQEQAGWFSAFIISVWTKRLTSVLSFFQQSLYRSTHVDENDVQTISHKCEVLTPDDFKRRFQNLESPGTRTSLSDRVFCCIGSYDPNNETLQTELWSAHVYRAVAWNAKSSSEYVRF